MARPTVNESTASQSPTLHPQRRRPSPGRRRRRRSPWRRPGGAARRAAPPPPIIQSSSSGTATALPKTMPPRSWPAWTSLDIPSTTAAEAATQAAPTVASAGSRRGRSAPSSSAPHHREAHGHAELVVGVLGLDVEVLLEEEPDHQPHRGDLGQRRRDEDGPAQHHVDAQEAEQRPGQHRGDERRLPDLAGGEEPLQSRSWPHPERPAGPGAAHPPRAPPPPGRRAPRAARAGASRRASRTWKRPRS